MKIKHRRARRMAGALLFAAVLAAGTFAFTAANTVPSSKAGFGSGNITGYTVSAVHYTLDATDPSKIDSVSFTVDSAPVAGSTVKVQLVTGGSWFTCAMSGSPAVNSSCTTTAGSPAVGVPVANANTLSVVATD